MRTISIGLAVIILLIAVPVFSGDWWSFGGRDHERGSGDMETVELDLKSFHRIDSDCSLDIFVEIGDEQKVLLTIDDNLIDNMVTRVRGKTLKVSARGSFSSRRGGQLEITVPSLDEIRLSGSGDIEIIGLDGEEFSYRLSGSGDLTAEGRVDNLSIRISGSGDVDTRDLIAKDVIVRVTGSGDAMVYAEESFDGHISGSGDITCWGDPEDVDKSTPGSGDIRIK